MILALLVFAIEFSVVILFVILLKKYIFIPKTKKDQKKGKN
jgi:hypothetical protein